MRSSGMCSSKIQKCCCIASAFLQFRWKKQKRDLWNICQNRCWESCFHFRTRRKIWNTRYGAAMFALWLRCKSSRTDWSLLVRYSSGNTSNDPTLWKRKKSACRSAYVTDSNHIAKVSEYVAFGCCAETGWSSVYQPPRKATDPPRSHLYSK